MAWLNNLTLWSDCTFSSSMRQDDFRAPENNKRRCNAMFAVCDSTNVAMNFRLFRVFQFFRSFHCFFLAIEKFIARESFARLRLHAIDNRATTKSRTLEQFRKSFATTIERTTPMTTTNRKSVGMHNSCCFNSFQFALSWVVRSKRTSARPLVYLSPRRKLNKIAQTQRPRAINLSNDISIGINSVFAADKPFQNYIPAHHKLQLRLIWILMTRQ